MKLRKCIFSALSIIPTLAIVPSIASCSKAHLSITDENWKPTIKQFESDNYFNAQQATDTYFEKVIKNKNIIVQDYCYSIVKNFIVCKQQAAEALELSNVTGTFKASASDIDLVSRVVKDYDKEVTTYFFTCTLCYDYEIKGEKIQTEQGREVKHTYTLIQKQTIKYKNIPVNIQDATTGWVVGPYTIYKSDQKWQSYMDVENTVIDSYPDKTGYIVTDEAEKQHYHRERTNEDSTGPDVISFDSYYLKNAKHQAKIKIVCEAHPKEYTQMPSLKNNTIEIGKEFSSDIEYQVISGYTFKITSVTCNNNPITDKTQFSIKPDGTGNIKIDADAINGPITIWTKYEPSTK